MSAIGPLFQRKGPVMTSLSMESIMTQMKSLQDHSWASTVYPTANLAIFVPFVLNQPTAVTKLFIANGASATGNIDLGIYNPDGTRITSIGSTAMAGANTIQSVNITNITIGPGRYYTAFAGSTTSASFWAANYNTFPQLAKFCGVYQQTSALPLPATATFATYAQTNFYLPYFGLLLAPINSV